MLKNYLRLTLRNLKKNKIYSFINIFGLSIGLACSMLMLIFVYSQLGYDSFNEKADQIYRLGREISSAEGERREPLSSARIGEVLKQDFPEVIETVRFKGINKSVVRYGNKQFYEQDMYYVDPTVFDVFTFPLIEGNAKTALKKPYSVVITDEMSKKYFGSENSLGKVLTFDNNNDFIVTGVIKNLPKQTHREINMLCSFSTLTENNQPGLNDWMNFDYYTYILLKEGTDYRSLEAKFPQLINRYIGRNTKNLEGTLSFYMLPLKKIYLYSHLDGYAPGLISEIVYYCLLAIFLTLIACINFINLSTARASVRAREIGLRKVVGAQKKQLVKQFLFEALVISFFALLFAFLLVQMFLPAFRDRVDVDLTLSIGQTLEIYLGFILIAIIVGIISGSYPAFYLAKILPIQSLKSGSAFKQKKSWFRTALVVIQFFISAILICHTFILNNEMKNIQQKDLGFNKKDVVVLPIMNDKVRQNIQTLKSALLVNPDIISVAAASKLPGFGIERNVKIPEGFSKSEMQLMDEIFVDSDFIPTLGIKVVDGRNFLDENKNDRENSIIVNQLAVQKYGWKNPIGKAIKYSIGQDEFAEAIVIGVVKDFHLSSLHRVIEPLYISNDPEHLNHILVRINPHNITGSIEFIKRKWNSLNPGEPFQYDFLERHYDEFAVTFGKIIDVCTSFAILAIILACLGIFALAAFIAERRTKEIGIRKVLGDSTFGIVLKLNLGLLKYVFIAALLTVPYAYLTKDFMSMFLPYAAGTDYFIYLKALVLVFAVALLSISYQSIKSAAANPIESLRYE